MSTQIVQEAPPAAPSLGVIQQAYTTHSSNESVGVFIGVLTVIIILGVIAVIIGKLCSGHRVMGFGDYDMEAWVETKCSSCVDGTIVSPRPPHPSPPPPQTNAAEENAPQEVKHDELEEEEGHVEDEEEEEEEESRQSPHNHSSK